MKPWLLLSCATLVCSCGDHGEKEKPAKNAASPASPEVIQSTPGKQPVPPKPPAAPSAETGAKDDGDLPPLNAINEMYLRVLALAKEDMPAAIRLANQAWKDRDPQLKHPELISNTMATAICQAAFPATDQFPSADAEKLRGLMKSELDPALKDHLLRRCVLDRSLTPVPALAVIDCVLQNNWAGGPLLKDLYATAAHDPPAAAKHILAQAWNPDLRLSTSRVFAEWVRSDPEAGSAAVKALPPASPSYQWAVAGLIQATRHFEPDSAAAWRKQITDSAAGDHADSLTYTNRRTP